MATVPDMGIVRIPVHDVFSAQVSKYTKLLTYPDQHEALTAERSAGIHVSDWLTSSW